MTLDRQQLDDLLVDYLYEELDPAEMAAFEAAAHDHPDVAAQIDGLRRTREVARALPSFAAPAGLFDGVLAAAASEAAVLAEQARAAAHAERPPSLWMRVYTWSTRPGFAALALAVVLIGVGVVMLERVPTTLGTSADDQRLAVSPTPGAATPAAAAEEMARASAGEEMARAPAADERDEAGESRVFAPAAREALAADGAEGAVAAGEAAIDAETEEARAVPAKPAPARVKSLARDAAVEKKPSPPARPAAVDDASDGDVFRDAPAVGGVQTGGGAKREGGAEQVAPRSDLGGAPVTTPSGPADAPRPTPASKPLPEVPIVVPSDASEALDEGNKYRRTSPGQGEPAPAEEQESAKTAVTRAGEAEAARIADLWRRYEAAMADGRLSEADAILAKIEAASARDKERAARARRALTSELERAEEANEKAKTLDKAQ